MNDHSPTSIIEGPDFRFGKGREGSMDTLAALGKDHGFDVMTIDPVETAIADCSIVRVSSSLIRWMLNQGRVRDAARLLGRPFEIEAIVVSGDKRGRSIGVPTANLDHRDFLLPADGIYSGRAIRADGAEFPAAISIGTKPTFGQSPRVCEAHLIGHRGPADEYGWLIRLQFNDWLRDQLKYADVNDLVDQLQRDIDRCDDNSPPWPSASHSLQSPTCSFARVT